MSEHNQVSIPSPCPMKWEQMEQMDGDDCSRCCQLCQTQVHNLSELTSKQIRSLLRETPAGQQGRCVRMERRQDGSLVTADPQQGKSKRLIASLLAGLAAMPLLSACSETRDVVKQADPEASDVYRGKSTGKEDVTEIAIGFGVVKPTRPLAGTWRAFFRPRL